MTILGGEGIAEPSQVRPEEVTGETLKPYLNPVRAENRTQHYQISY